MIYWRYETEEIRQGFNFYPRNDGGSVGCQMMFGRLRTKDIELDKEKQPIPSKNKRRSTAWVK